MKLAHTTFQNRNNSVNHTKFAAATVLTAGILLASGSAKAWLNSDATVLDMDCSQRQTRIWSSNTVKVDDRELSLFDWIRSKAFGVKKTVIVTRPSCKSKPIKPKCFSSAKPECEVWGNRY